MLGLSFCLFTVKSLSVRALSLLALPFGGPTLDLTISSKDLIPDCISSVPLVYPGVGRNHTGNLAFHLYLYLLAEIATEETSELLKHLLSTVEIRCQTTLYGDGIDHLEAIAVVSTHAPNNRAARRGAQTEKRERQRG